MDVVLNWLAQGVVVALAAAAVLQVIPSARTQLRYGFVWAAYLSVLVLPVLAPLLTVARDAGLEVAPAVTALTTVPVAWWTSATLAIGLWTVWFAIHVVVLGRGLLAAHDAKRCAQPCPRNLLRNLPHWSRVTATGRSARVVLSERVRLAGVLGCGAAVIAIAPRVVDELSASDLDRVLVHEWAHLQRRDELADVVQRVARAIVGWHPAAWWLERQLELERELACDEIAVRVTGSAKRYAECLVTLASLNRAPDRTLAIVAAVSRSRLRQRVERILSAASTPAVHSPRALVISSAIGFLACVWAAGNVRVVVPAVESMVVTATGNGQTVEPRAPVSPQSFEPGTSAPKVVAARNLRPTAHVRSAVRNAGVAVAVGDTHAVEELSTTAIPSLPLPSLLDASSAMALPVIEASAQAPANGHADVVAPGLRQPAADDSKGWTQAADAGVAISRASRDAGIATAGFFRRFGKRVAGSF